MRVASFVVQVNALGDRVVEVAESISGRPVEEVMVAWTALSDLVRPATERVLARGATVGE